MKSKILGAVFLATYFCFVGNVYCQIDYSAVKTVTLESRRVVDKKDNYTNAAFSFEKAVNGESGKQITRNDWDLYFYTIRRADGVIVKDLFSVTMITDDCSRIQDLGELNWTDNFKIPELPAYDKPTREAEVAAIVGHIYLVHTKDRDSDLLALFRVEELTSGESVKISWTLISEQTDN